MPQRTPLLALMLVRVWYEESTPRARKHTTECKYMLGILIINVT